MNSGTYVAPVEPDVAQNSHCGNCPQAKTGWPAPALMQDDNRKLFRWFADRLGSRRLVRLAAEEIRRERGLVPKD